MNLRKLGGLLGTALLLMGLSPTALGQTVAWTKLMGYSTGSGERATAFRVNAAGDNVVAGTSGGTLTYVVMNDTSGTQKFASTYTESTLGGLCEPKAIAIGPTYVYVACKVYLPHGPISFPPPVVPAIRLLRITISSGAVTALPIYLYQNHPSEPVDIVLDSNEIPYVTGTTIISSSTGKDILTASFTSAGVLRWEETYAGTGVSTLQDDYPLGMGVDSQGNIMVGGSTRGTLGDSNHFTALRYQAATSITPPRRMWARRYHDYEYYRTDVNNFYFYNDTVYLTGQSRSNSIPNFEVNTVGYDKTGPATPGYDLLINGSAYMGTAQSNYNDSSNGVAATSSGVFINSIINYFYMGTMFSRYIMFNSSVIYDEPLPGMNPVSMSGNGSAFAVTGQTFTPPYTVFTKKYPSGWSATFNYGFGDNLLTGSGMASDGSVFIAGSTTNASGNVDFFVRKYSP